MRAAGDRRAAGIAAEPPGGAAAARRRSARARLPALGRTEFRLQAGIGALVVAYALSTFVVHRSASGYNTMWDGWVENAASLLPIVPVLRCARRSTASRSAWRAIAVAIGLYNAANLVYTYHDQNLRPIPNPAPSDVLYLFSYAAFIAGVALLTQKNLGRVHISLRLDGAISGLALTSLAGLLWFKPLLDVSGNPMQVVVNMTYPLSDLVLLVLLVAGLAPSRYRPDWPTSLMMAGVAWFVVGDVISANETIAGTYRAGTPLDATWVIGLFLMGLAASARDRRAFGARRANDSAFVGRTFVPAMSGLVSIGVIGIALHAEASPVVVVMALAALGLVIVRMWVISAVNYQDARTDVLTGLANRRSFVERVQSELAGDGADGAGVILIDLDGFKDVNDALGHGMGDELLYEVARRFARRIGDRGFLARLGGDEFACVTPLEREEDLVAMAHELSETLAAPCELDGVTVRVGGSFGVAASSADDATAGELLRCADVAMYEAKRNQSRVSVYRAAEDPNNRKHLELLGDLRQAVDERALTLHFQPTLDIRTADLCGVEALVRWQHRDLGFVYPDRFIPMAERAGLMPQVTRAVLDLAVAEAARLDWAGHRLRMNVNISRYDLVDEGFPAFVAGVLDRHSFPVDRLTLEVTETALGSDPERAKRTVNELREAGMRISIDDFGVGYSSVSQLLDLSIDELKIDRSFITAICSDARAQAIVRSAIELARALDLTVVAEGIEREDALHWLNRLGADIGQGYFIAMPLTAQQLGELLVSPPNSFGLRPDLNLLATGY